ncbi:slc35b4, partial [Symbiodinium necroappetens]
MHAHNMFDNSLLLTHLAGRIQARGLKPLAAPLASHAKFSALWVSMSVLANYAFAYKISVAIFTLIRSCNIIATVLLGYTVFGERFSAEQLLCVLAVTVGIFLASLGEIKTLNTSGPTSAECSSLGTCTEITTRAPDGDVELATWAIGIAMLAFVQLLQGFLGHVQSSYYKIYKDLAPKNELCDEFLFTSHVAALLPLLCLKDDILAAARAAMASEPVPYLPFHLPRQILWLLVNNVSQTICLKGVFRTSATVTPLALTIILSVRKFLSVVVSIVLFSNPWTPQHSAATVLIFGGAFAYSQVREARPATTGDNKKGCLADAAAKVDRIILRSQVLRVLRTLEPLEQYELRTWLDKVRPHSVLVGHTITQRSAEGEVVEVARGWAVLIFLQSDRVMEVPDAGRLAELALPEPEWTHGDMVAAAPPDCWQHRTCVAAVDLDLHGCVHEATCLAYMERWRFYAASAQGYPSWLNEAVLRARTRQAYVAYAGYAGAGDCILVRSWVIPAPTTQDTSIMLAFEVQASGGKEIAGRASPLLLRGCLVLDKVASVCGSPSQTTKSSYMRTGPRLQEELSRLQGISEDLQEELAVVCEQRDLARAHEEELFYVISGKDEELLHAHSALADLAEQMKDRQLEDDAAELLDSEIAGYARQLQDLTAKVQQLEEENAELRAERDRTNRKREKLVEQKQELQEKLKQSEQARQAARDRVEQILNKREKKRNSGDSKDDRVAEDLLSSLSELGPPEKPKRHLHRSRTVGAIAGGGAAAAEALTAMKPVARLDAEPGPSSMQTPAEAMLPVFGMPDTPVLTQRPLARSFGAGGMLARNVAPEDVADILQIPLSQVQEAKGAMELTGSTCYEETGESPLEEDEDGADEEPFSPVFVSPDGPSLEVPTAEPEADE